MERFQGYRQVLLLLQNYIQGYTKRDADLLFHATGKVEKLRNGILNGEVMSDEDAARSLGYANSRVGRYRMAKSRFRSWLLKRFVFVEINRTKMPPIKSAMCEVSFKQIAARFLFHHGISLLGHEVNKEAKLKAEKFGFTLIEIECLQHMRTEAALKGQKDQYTLIDEQLSKQIAIYNAELHSFKALDFVIVTHIGSPIPDTSIIPELKDYLTLVRINVRKYGTPTLKQNYLNLKIYYAQIVNDSRLVIESCQQLQSWYAEFPEFASDKLLARLNVQHAFAYHVAGEALKGVSLVEKAIALEYSISYNNMLIYEQAFQIFMHARAYKKALKILQRISRQLKSGIRLEEMTRKKWIIFELFLRLVYHEARQLRNSLIAQGYYSSKKVLELIPDFKDDKAGFCVSVIVIQVYILIEEFIETRSAVAMDQIIDRAASLQRYLRTHLSPEKAYCAQCLIRTIVEIIRAEFNVVRARQLVDDYKEKITLWKVGFDGDIDNIQVIPFPELLEMIFNLVKKIDSLGLIVRPIIEEKVSRLAA